MTLHASKGLEFPHVYLMGMEEGLLPHQSAIDEGNIEEERRLTYVGITRAEKTLHIIVAEKRQRYGELLQTSPSRFLEELPQEDLDWEINHSPLSDDQKREKGQDRLARLRLQLKDDPS
jgi:ATP-dependent DNA helicase Rep